jgi:hypothetical protein
MALHQPCGYRRARPVELARAVARLAEQHHPAIGEAVEHRSERRVVDRGERLHGRRKRL